LYQVHMAVKVEATKVVIVFDLVRFHCHLFKLLMHSFYYFSMINFKIQHIVQYQPLSLWSYKFLHYLVQINSKIPMNLHHTKRWRLVIAHCWACIHF
jgi:hypothetical protein